MAFLFVSQNGFLARMRRIAVLVVLSQSLGNIPLTHFNLSSSVGRVRRLLRRAYVRERVWVSQPQEYIAGELELRQKLLLNTPIGLGQPAICSQAMLQRQD